MNRIGRSVMRTWFQLGPRFLPFADVASDDLPLSRLLRLSLFQVSVGMALVLMAGTLNRVMIVELGVPASLVALMLALPLLFAPLRALIGFRSDVHRSPLGWKRVPYIWQGTLLQFGGLAIMPFALLVLSGGGEAASAPVWIGQASAALSFLLVGAGMHMVQTVGLALATDLAPPEDQPKVVGLMYVMLLFGMVGSALVFGAMLAEFNNLRLVQVIQGCAVVTVALNVIALWKQETRDPNRHAPGFLARRAEARFADAWRGLIRVAGARRRLVAIGLGTMAFSMSEVILEPFGGEVLRLSVAETTKLTALLAFGTLIGFGWASRVLGAGGNPIRMANYGAAVGLPAFAAVILSTLGASAPLFACGVFLIGFGAGLFSHGTLTATMRLAPADQVGLALGVWGAVQATAAGVGIAAGGVLRDVVLAGGGAPANGAASGYLAVFAVEMILLVAALAILLPLHRTGPGDSGVETREPSALSPDVP